MSTDKAEGCACLYRPSVSLWDFAHAVLPLMAAILAAR
jgi:hypothetical protein